MEKHYMILGTIMLILIMIPSYFAKKYDIYNKKSNENKMTKKGFKFWMNIPIVIWLLCIIVGIFILPSLSTTGISMRTIFYTGISSTISLIFLGVTNNNTPNI